MNDPQYELDLAKNIERWRRARKQTSVIRNVCGYFALVSFLFILITDNLLWWILGFYMALMWFSTYVVDGFNDKYRDWDKTLANRRYDRRQINRWYERENGEY